MDQIKIRGGRPLNGSIEIGGAKNAALPLMAASLLTTGCLTLSNIPHLTDIVTLAHLLGQLGVGIEMNGHDENGGHAGRVLSMRADRLTSTTAPYDLVRRMRASVLVLGPLVARRGEAHVSMPGGCAIGTRPIDLHLSGLERLGAEIELADGYVHARAPNGLRGADIHFTTASVGATENVLMAATLAEGESVLTNAAREPEITDLARCLVAMGADIEGIGSERLVVRGQAALHGADYAVMPDRVEAGSYAVAAAITGGEIELVGAERASLEAVIDSLEESGVNVEESDKGLKVSRRGNAITPVDIESQPYPGFPTDMQAQMTALLAMSNGTSRITESIFENRFMHVPELSRMGAEITLRGSTAEVRGVPRLRGAQVMATDLRASVCLVLAGLAAEGETTVGRVYHLDRGYERLVDKLAACGADIERVAA